MRGAPPAQLFCLKTKCFSRRAGCDAESSPKQGAHDFWLLIPKRHCPRSKAWRLHLFFFPKWVMAEHGEPGSHGCASPSKPEPSPTVTPTYLIPSRSRNGRTRSLPLLLHYFFSSSGTGRSHTVPYRGCHQLPAGGSVRDSVRTMLHLIPEGYCRHFYNIYKPHGTFCVTKVSKNINHQN